MTDKQIIIDGVDVSGCGQIIDDYQQANRITGKYEHFYNICECGCRSVEFYNLYCKDNPNCYYKKWQRKEQECEELQQYHNKCCEEFEKEKKEWLEKYNQVSRDFYNGKYCNAEKCQQLDQLKAEVKSKTEYIQEQREIINHYSKEIEMYKKCQGKRASKREEELKAENEKYSLFIEKLCDYAGLECDSEEQAMRTLSDLASQMNKARWMIDRYKQTLTEIKTDILYIREGISYFWVIDKCDKILQKISEVENET